MKNRNILTIIALSVLVIAVVFAGYRMLSGLQEKKIRYDVDLYTLIPADCKAVFCFRNAREYFSHPVAAGFSTALWDSVLNKLIVDGLLVSLHREGAVLYKKMAVEEIDTFLSPLNSGFKAETRCENNIKINIITTVDDRFFCYFYHQGVWVGSLKKRLIDRVIKNMGSPDGILRDDSLFNTALKGLGENVAANVIFNADSVEYIRDSVRQQNVLCSFPHSWVGTDLSKIEGNLCLSGIINDAADEKSEKHLFQPELLPYNSFLVYQPCDGNGYDVCFTFPDSLPESGKVRVLPIESREHYNRVLNEELLRKEVLIYNDYALFADSSAIIEKFVASLALDSLKAKNVLVKLFSVFNQPVENGFSADLGLLLCDTVPAGFTVPSCLQERKSLLAPYCLYYYTYNEEGRRFFNLVFSPKK